MAEVMVFYMHERLRRISDRFHVHLIAFPARNFVPAMSKN